MTRERWDERIADALDRVFVHARLSGSVGENDGFDPHGFFVYVLTANDGSPLYVGQSQNVLARLGTHLSNPRRRSHIARVKLIRCGSRSEMTHTEHRMIWELRPKWNINGNPFHLEKVPARRREAS